MKILHTADWHLGNNFHGHDRYVEHRHFLNWLLAALRSELPDVLIIAGDIFDSGNPSAVAEGLLYDFLLDATEAVPGLQVVMVAGNHDSAGRLDAPAELLKRHNIYVRGAVRRDDEGDIHFDDLLLPLGRRLSAEAEIVCLALPYLRVYDYPAGMTAAEGVQYYFQHLMACLRKSPFRGLPVVAAAHFYAAGAEICSEEHSERLVVGGQDCVPAEMVGTGICYTALGHIHRAQRVECEATEMYYSGSALPMSFSERNYQHGVQVVQVEADGSVEVRRLPYSPLRRLLAIPYQGNATEAEVLEAIGNLPRREKDESDESWPYLEIRLLEDQPSPNLLHQVTEALADKSVHFCRMLRELPEREKAELGGQRENLQALTPLEMARKVYENRYHGDMPEELVTRFMEAEELSTATLP